MGSKPAGPSGPSAADQAQAAQLAAQQAAEKKKLNDLRLSLSRARLGGSGGSASGSPVVQGNSGLLG